MSNLFELIDKLSINHSLEKEEYLALLKGFNSELQSYAAQKAVSVTKSVYGNKIFIRGLIEISNFCKNDCYYCGIRRSNKKAQRYRLTKHEIISCCKEGYRLGFRTFVMQAGEDSHLTDDFLIEIITEIKSLYPDCAVTLSLGERTKESYQRLFCSGADRYLLRHETANEKHYSLLHPESMSYKNRIECLYNLKEIGYQVGCGIMVGSPYQTLENIANDLKFIEEFSPDMYGIGPYITHNDTPFKNMESGSVELTLFLLSLVRLMKPNILLPATTALGTLSQDGREKGILSGANVVMPNLSPLNVREKYALYNNKIATGSESAQQLHLLKNNLKSIGYEIAIHRGDIIK